MSQKGFTDDSRAYVTVKIPTSLAAIVDQYLMEEDAAIRGFRSRSSVVVAALVEFMERKGMLQKNRFTHINVNDGYALIKDNLVGATAYVSFRLPDKAYCELCERWDGCEHVRYALSLEKVRKPLSDAGFRFLENIH